MSTTRTGKSLKVSGHTKTNNKVKPDSYSFDETLAMWKNKAKVDRPKSGKQESSDTAGQHRSAADNKKAVVTRPKKKRASTKNESVKLGYNAKHCPMSPKSPTVSSLFVLLGESGEDTEVTAEITEHSLTEHSDDNILISSPTKTGSKLGSIKSSKTKENGVEKDENKKENRQKENKMKDKISKTKRHEKIKDDTNPHVNESLRSKEVLQKKEIETVEKGSENRMKELEDHVEELTALLKNQSDMLTAKEYTIMSQRKLIKSLENLSLEKIAKDQTIMSQRELLRCLEKNNDIERVHWKKKLARRNESIKNLKSQLRQKRPNVTD